VAVVCLCALGLSACASHDKKVDLEQLWNQDKEEISTSIQQLQDVQANAEIVQQQQAAKLAALQGRVASLERLNQTQQAELKALSSHMQRLQRKNNTRAKIRAKAKKYAAAPKHASRIQPKQRTTPVKALPPVAAVPNVDKAAAAEAEKNAYTAAYLALKSGRYDEAATAFNKQLDTYPAGEYADQAWYWLGETRLAQNATGKAFNAFKYVADHYAGSVKHAVALMKLGQISNAQHHSQQAAKYYKRLIQEHADSSLAEQAREALKRTQASAPQVGSPQTPGN